MADVDWRDRGETSRSVERLRGLMDLGIDTDFHTLHNDKTGHDAVAYMAPHQTLSQAIANHQFQELDSDSVGAHVSERVESGVPSVHHAVSGASRNGIAVTVTTLPLNDETGRPDSN
jgi:hypothetical protein